MFWIAVFVIFLIIMGIEAAWALIPIMLLFVIAIILEVSTNKKKKGKYGENQRNKRQQTYQKGKNTKPQLYANLSKLATMEYEFPRHEQVLRESAKIIETTNNLETLLGRYKDAMNEWEWIEQRINEGIPIHVSVNDKDFPSMLKRGTNENILRVAETYYTETISHCNQLKTEKGKQNKLTTVFDFVERCKYELKENENRRTIELELDEIYYHVENNISNILQGKPIENYTKQ